MTGEDGGRTDASVELAQAVGAATAEGRPSAGQVRALLGAAARSGRTAGIRAVASGRWLAETAFDAAGHLPVRRLATLQEHHRGLGGDALAAELIERAALAAGAVGAATGALAAVSELNPGTWTTLPVELAGETLVVVAIEMKLVAELHEVAGRPIQGTATQRAALVAKAWSESRGLQPEDIADVSAASTAAELLSGQARSRITTALRRRMMRRAGRNLTSMAPFLAGAAAGGALNRRATTRLGRDVARSLGLRRR